LYHNRFSLVEIEHLQPVWRYVAFWTWAVTPKRRVHHPARR